MYSLSKASRIHDFLENCKILAENSEKIIQFLSDIQIIVQIVCHYVTKIAEKPIHITKFVIVSKDKYMMSDVRCLRSEN